MIGLKNILLRMIIVRVENCIFDRKTSGTFISDFFFNFQIENATQRRNAKNATKLDSASEYAKLSLRYVQLSRNFLEGEVADFSIAVADVCS